MAQFIIAGGSGFVGKQLEKLLISMNHKVWILSTKAKSGSYLESNLVFWDTKKGIIDEGFKLENANLINLAGAGVVDKRWTDERKKYIIESRTQSLSTLYSAIKKGQLSINHLVSASAIGYYPEASKIYVESAMSDNSFLSKTCQLWETTALQFNTLDIPVAIARIGIVLGKEGGALKALSDPMKFGIVGIPSSGKQIYSWIELNDLTKLILFLSETQKMGIYNAVAPFPCDINSIFNELKKYHKTFLTAHAPNWVLNLLLGEMSIEVLKSCQVSAQKIIDAGFQFECKNIEQAIAKIYKKEF